MSSVITSGAHSNKDFSPKTPPPQSETFRELYDEIISQLSYLAQIEDHAHFKIELQKLRKKIQAIIIKHFNPSLLQLSNHNQYQSIVKQHQQKLKNIESVLCR